MKIKILLLGCLYLLISSGVDAKQKTPKIKKSEQTQQNEQIDVLQKKDKPKMCYTHTKKWHPCPVQSKNKKEQIQ